MSHQLAQINVARCRAPLDTPVMRGFVELLTSVNELAEASPGFIWRLKTDEGDSTGIRAYDDPLMIVNISVWGTLEDLRNYAYRSAHADAFRRRKEWFEPMEAPSLGLWWIPAGRLPAVDEGKACLSRIEARGPTPEAFTFRNSFPPPPG